jgi:DnaJ domain
MDAGDQVCAQGFVNGAVAVDAGHGCKSGRADGHVEMRLTAITPAAMATMAFAIIDNFEAGGRKGRGQAIFYFIGDRHNRASLHIGPSICRNNPYSLASESERPMLMSKAPFEFDMRVSADKKRRKTGRRGFSGAFDTSTQGCDFPGCKEGGIYRAPKSPDLLDEFFWFCKDHVREYNLKWNFFQGTTDEDFQKFLEKDRVWGRETEPFTKRPDEGRVWSRLGVNDPIEILGSNATQNPGRATGSAPTRKLPAPERKALEILDARDTWTKPEIRKQYKGLVKDLHPDMNGGNRDDEDRLQEVVWAWDQIKDSRFFRD